MRYLVRLTYQRTIKIDEGQGKALMALKINPEDRTVVKINGAVYELKDITSADSI